MTKRNLTYIEQKLLLIVYNEGLRIGKDITKLIESGQLPVNGFFKVIINSFHDYFDY